jgi:hypothetical protein
MLEEAVRRQAFKPPHAVGAALQVLPDLRGLVVIELSRTVRVQVFFGRV